jgi:TctA family transporter
MIPTWSDLKQMVRPMMRSAPVGTIIGVLPGAGATIAAFVAYSLEVRFAKNKSRLGKGAIEGITAPETANNAAAQGGFIPTLALGLPGDAVMALMLGALMIHGVNPGPQFISENPEMLVFMNIPMIGLWVRLLSIPYKYLFPSVLLLVCVGVYSVNKSAVDIIVAAIFAVVGYAMYLTKMPAAPLLLGVVLGSLMEENFRRTMLLSRGDFAVFLERPICAVLIGLSVILLIWPLLRLGERRMRRSKR